MTSRPPSDIAARALRRALRQIRRYGIEGPVPVEALERLAARRQAAVELVCRRLESARPEELAPLVHVARLLRLEEAVPAVAAAVLRRPAPWEAKREAIELLRRLGHEIPAEVVETVAAVEEFLARSTPAGLERVLSLPPAWRRPATEAWLAGERLGAPLLERLLEEEPELEDRIIEALGRSGDPAALPILLRLQRREGSRQRRKAVRRALHRLRSEGLEVPEAREAEAGFSLALRPDVLHDSRAFVTGVDGGGGRLLWLLTPSDSGGERLLEVVLDDESGIRRAEVLAVTRRGVREHVERLRDNPAVLVAQVPPAEAAAILLAAERLTQQKGGELPGAYGSWRQELGAELVSAAADVPAGEDGAAEEAPREAEPDRLAAAAELLGRPFFGGWVLEHPAVQEAARDVRAAETSRVALDERQRKEQIDAAIRRAANVFDDPMRERYRRRLLAMADVLQRLRRAEDAALARAAAEGFVRVADLYEEHPFARALIQRSVLLAYERLPEVEAEVPPAERILRPGGAR